ncbi:hypothetical protein HXX76_002570 [Chlamydomonas incerta]|uniref:Fe2OG dioxygenase domain-containing protein n=1 Tax=Chlamydomonas incerta TaxID=51695 RepID=A0A835W947_CHLIN|nr:hypothetical protein HXX76_002570 [Chlamydomonas incerta]|eukprot:KAG2442484.1 hypothetical protein HXX76_002570 [Chlamydomonas incerta]
MADWKEQLKLALDGVVSGGNFAVTGTVDGPLPEVAVRGVGKLALPIDADQANDLIFAGLPAPYGKGAKTVLDPAVRKATQFEADRVRFSDDWDATIRRVATGAATALGVSGGGASVEAHLYKLLVYEPGGHFTAHRDTEKEPGMFGTLLVQLPVAGGHTGGELSISHQQGREEFWDTEAAAAAAAGAPAAGGGNSGATGAPAGGFQQQQQPVLQYAAFYADCEHELSQVKSGLRVVLAYNLVRVQQAAVVAAAAATTAAASGDAAAASIAGPPTANSSAPSSASAVTEAVRAWEAAASSAGAGAAVQPLVTLLLAHRYTETNLDFGMLKGDDAAKVQALLECPLLDVHLVLFTKEVSGRADMYCSDGDPEEDLEYAQEMAGMDEEYFCETEVKAWVSPLFGRLRHVGGKDALGLKLEELEDSLLGGEQVFPDDLTPDMRMYVPHTGNEGPDITYWYHRALAVVWPRSRRPMLPAAVQGCLTSA